MAVFSSPRFGRSRHAAIAGVLVIVLVWYLSPRWDVRQLQALEWERLENHMNGKHSQPEAVFRKSSFDWSSVPFRYPAADNRPLPKGARKQLPRIQHDFKSGRVLVNPNTQESRRQEVRSLFAKNWHKYKKHAWKHDSLQPLSGGFQDQFSGWGATLVDSLDTLWIMGFREEFDEAVAAVAEIDFGESTGSRVNTFETMIRYLGGLLAAYDLSQREVLLQKATELGNLLYSAFNTPNGMPVDFIDFAAAKTGQGLEVEGQVVSASPGTLSLEMTRLSQVTGDPKYYTAASRVMDLFAAGQNNTKMPGMWPMFVSMRHQDVTSGNRFTVAGCADSLYEYLPKMHALMGGADSKYEIMTQNFMDVAPRLFYRPMVPKTDGYYDDMLMAGVLDILEDADGAGHHATLDPETEHLSCFIGGLYALGGRLLERDDHVELGRQLARGCVFAYRSMPSGLAPERWNMVTCPAGPSASSPPALCDYDDRYFKEHASRHSEFHEQTRLPPGFATAKDPRYILRPEAIESVFVLWRVTGDPEWQEAAWEMWKAVSQGTWAEDAQASAAVLDVTRDAANLPHEDYMEVRRWLMGSQTNPSQRHVLS